MRFGLILGETADIMTEEQRKEIINLPFTNETMKTILDAVISEDNKENSPIIDILENSKSLIQEIPNQRNTKLQQFIQQQGLREEKGKHMRALTDIYELYASIIVEIKSNLYYLIKVFVFRMDLSNEELKDLSKRIGYNILTGTDQQNIQKLANIQDIINKILDSLSNARFLKFICSCTVSGRITTNYGNQSFLNSNTFQHSNTEGEDISGLIPTFQDFFNTYYGINFSTNKQSLDKQVNDCINMFILYPNYYISRVEKNDDKLQFFNGCFSPLFFYSYSIILEKFEKYWHVYLISPNNNITKIITEATKAREDAINRLKAAKELEKGAIKKTINVDKQAIQTTKNVRNVQDKLHKAQQQAQSQLSFLGDIVLKDNEALLKGAIKEYKSAVNNANQVTVLLNRAQKENKIMTNKATKATNQAVEAQGEVAKALQNINNAGEQASTADYMFDVVRNELGYDYDIIIRSLELYYKDLLGTPNQEKVTDLFWQSVNRLGHMIIHPIKDVSDLISNQKQLEFRVSYDYGTQWIDWNSRIFEWLDDKLPYITIMDKLRMVEEQYKNPDIDNIDPNVVKSMYQLLAIKSPGAGSYGFGLDTPHRTPKRHTRRSLKKRTKQKTRGRSELRSVPTRGRSDLRSAPTRGRSKKKN